MHHGAELLREPRVVLQRLDHQRDDEAAWLAARGVLEADLGDAAASRGPSIADRQKVLGDPPLELGSPVLHRREQQVFLVLEVVVERALVSPPPWRCGRSRRLVAEAGEAFDRDVGEVAPPVGRRAGRAGDAILNVQ